MNMKNIFSISDVRQRSAGLFFSIEFSPMCARRVEDVQRSVQRRRSPAKQKTKKEEGKPFKIDTEKCIKCGMCFETCKFEAVEVE